MYLINIQVISQQVQFGKNPIPSRNLSDVGLVFQFFLLLKWYQWGLSIFQALVRYYTFA